jgi:glyoxylase-like metal-dependent hydrolase (beta-lactamase superfamily II)
MSEPNFYRYAVGDIAITVLFDGLRTGPITDSYILNASRAEINGALAEAGLPADQVTNSYAPIMIETAGRRVLVDAGNGEASFIESKGARGQLAKNLVAAGIAPETIDTVVISHFHSDHVNGLLTAANTPAFPNAEIKVPAVEWAFWMDDGEMARASKGRMAELFVNNRRIFDALGREVTVYDWGREVAPGVTAIATPGHSIGHTSYVAASGRDSLFVQSDVSNIPPLFVRHPGWHGGFDQDPVQAEATRRKTYDMLAAERIPIQAYHHPFHGRGLIERDGDSYRRIAIGEAVPSPSQ